MIAARTAGSTGPAEAENPVDLARRYELLDECAGAALHRRVGSADPVLRCPRCHAHFDVVHAGACVDDNATAAEHLEPLPVLVRDGVLSIAMAVEPTTAGVP